MLMPAAEILVRSAGPRSGHRVIDLGCGTGNAALLAAEAGARVTGVDPAGRLLEVARERYPHRFLGHRSQPHSASSAAISLCVTMSISGAGPHLSKPTAYIDRKMRRAQRHPDEAERWRPGTPPDSRGKRSGVRRGRG